jgi:hypothetical protein
MSSDPEKRLKTLQTGAHKKLRLIARFPFQCRQEAHTVEQEIHRKFSHLRLSQGEWFKRTILKEMKQGRKRVIGGSYENPTVTTPS